ncbi:hypothetical protein BC938DRAFT_480707 [Jimgerdemannia flammicorona]|uniref:Uncharacterized protein n=1 Tax=Jimgerdemannia flammicorona TaxID=994334 RepID=A0A433QHY0_9FUNG|nr:hypothetical protein BC938DRAFT_480707 [Jimgerdemannia flammicorona]
MANDNRATSDERAPARSATSAHQRYWLGCGGRISGKYVSSFARDRNSCNRGSGIFRDGFRQSRRCAERFWDWLRHWLHHIT